MSCIVPFPRHRLHGRWCCTGVVGGVPDNCTACVLALCTTCGGAEASLPTDCPQRRMSALEEDEVQAGLLDFKLDRGWHVPARMRTPTEGEQA